jgi:hypothetical protein
MAQATQRRTSVTAPRTVTLARWVSAALAVLAAVPATLLTVGAFVFTTGWFTGSVWPVTTHERWIDLVNGLATILAWTVVAGAGAAAGGLGSPGPRARRSWWTGLWAGGVVTVAGATILLGDITPPGWWVGLVVLVAGLVVEVSLVLPVVRRWVRSTNRRGAR